MKNDRQMMKIVAGWVVAFWLVVVTPWPITLSFDMAIAAAWCLWLERHPDGEKGSLPS